MLILCLCYDNRWVGLKVSSPEADVSFKTTYPIAATRTRKNYTKLKLFNLDDCFRASEGKTVEVPYRGDVTVTMLDVLGGIRSACTYVGAGKLKEMSKRTTFIRFYIYYQRHLIHKYPI